MAGRTGEGRSVRLWLSTDLEAAVDALAKQYRVDSKALMRQLIAEAVLQRENQLRAPAAMADAAIAQLLVGQAVAGAD